MPIDAALSLVPVQPPALRPVSKVPRADLPGRHQHPPPPLWQIQESAQSPGNQTGTYTANAQMAYRQINATGLVVNVYV